MKKFCSFLLGLLLAIPVFPAIGASADGIAAGDINSDGKVDAVDASCVLTYYSEQSTGKNTTFTAEQVSAADLNSDGRTDANDATMILAYYAYISTHEHISASGFVQCYPALNAAHIESPYCKAAVLKCLDGKQIMYMDNIDDKTAPASLTKLLTASVALNYLDKNTLITVGTELELVQPYSSLCLIQQGHRLKLYDLLTGMLMASGNDAAYTVAVNTARAVKGDASMSDEDAVTYFTGLMNDYAAKIGMKNSHFVNPEGWDDDSQYTTVSDLLTLAEYAYSVPEIREITGVQSKTVTFDSGEIADWVNSNCLLDTGSDYYMAEAKGMKTGTTLAAGNCLIGVFVVKGKTYISVVVGCNEHEDRYELTKKLIQSCT